MRIWIFIFIVFLFQMPGFSQEEKEVPDILKSLDEILPPNPERVMRYDSKTSTLIVRDTPTNHKKLAEILKDMDIGIPQISIESRFVELVNTDLFELGIQWGNSLLWYEYTSAPPQMRKSDGTTISAQRDVAKMITGGRTPGAQGNLVTFGQETTQGLSFQIARLKPTEFDLIIHALAQNDKANLLSSPKITAINNQKAVIQVVHSIPYISDYEIENVGSASVFRPKWTYTMAEEKEGITLIVTPKVGKDSKVITLELEPEVKVLVNRLSFIATTEDLGWPVIDRRATSTTMMVQSGETVVMGGLMDERDDKITQKVPILGDIPLFGNLFRHNYTKRIKKNLLIFVTASLINPEGKIVE